MAAVRPTWRFGAMLAAMLMLADAALTGVCAETSFDGPGQSCSLRSHGTAATCR